MTKIIKLLYYCVNRFYFTIMVFLDAGLPNDALIELQTIMCIILQATFFYMLLMMPSFLSSTDHDCVVFLIFLLSLNWYIRNSRFSDGCRASPAT